ncbi:hypothetical protein V5799_013951 [Amblyomma americanum]|uniref:Uncharacterized protein n=1 Tax=Amblyomma americanum TaxID=6943 RepID=A0AAQ4E4F6_AMBAM
MTDEIAKLLEQKVRENAGSEKLALKLLIGANIVRNCASEHSEDGQALLKKMFVPIVSEGAKCAASKAGIADAVERDLAEKICFRDAADSTKASTQLTEKETAIFDAIRACTIAAIPSPKV